MGEIQVNEFFNLRHYEYGEAFFGSHKGMRYRLAREPLSNVFFTPVDQRDPDDRLMATVWPEPYAYGKADPATMVSEKFEITQEGFEAAVAWINEQYETRIKEWQK